MLSYAPTLLGSTTPRIFTPPLVTGPPGPCGCGCALTPATSKGFSAVDFAQDVLGMRPLPWQRFLLIHALELRPTGRFRFRTVVVMVARQNGKTTIVEVKNLWKMFVLGVPLIIGTAQDLDMAEESWDNAVTIVESIPELDAEKVHVDRTNGKKALRLANGSRWKIKAASRKAGRGLSGDDVNLDELREHQNWLAWGAVTKTTMARPNSQIWAFSNAGDDSSVVLNDLQVKGRRTATRPDANPTLGHFEWSAPDDTKCTCSKPDDEHALDCRLQDRERWAMGNPAYGYTITDDAMLSALGTDPEGIFLAECLCVHVGELIPQWQVFTREQWGRLVDVSVSPADRVGSVALSAETTQDRSMSAIDVVFRTADGMRHVEVVEFKAGATWVVPRIVELLDRYEVCAVVIDKVGAASSFVDELEALEVEVLQPTATEVTDSYGQFYDACVPGDGEDGEPLEPTVRHLDQDSLNAAVAGALARRIGDREALDRKAGPHMPPFVAATLALWGLVQRGDDYEVEDSVW